MVQQGIVTVLNRETSFGMFGGGDANTCDALTNICGTSGGNTTRGGVGVGAGKSAAWSTRRAVPDAAVVPPALSDATSKSASIAMAAAPAKITCITPRR
jgi:hypothetical protein